MRRVLLLLPLAVACSPEAPLLPEADGARGLVLVVHGGGDDPTVWAEDMALAVEDALDDPGSWRIVPLDWSEDADSSLTAARRGRSVGEALGEQLAEGDYDAVHVIAHSVGAHLAHGLATREPPVQLQLTLLDPFVGSGLFRWEYGRDRFGDHTDFAEAYVNRDDGVPSTDGLLDGTHLFDLTHLRPADRETSEEGHRWPIAWYQDSAGSGLGLDLALGAGGDARWPEFPAGGRTSVSE